MLKNKLFDPFRIDRMLEKSRSRGRSGAAAEFGRTLAGFTGRKRCLLAASGTQAVKIALTALKPARVALPAVTHGSLLGAVLDSGAEPVFLDIDLSNLNVSRRALEKAAGTFDILLNADMFGASAGPDFLESLAKKRGFTIIDDASQIIGHSFAGRNYGSFGLISVFSLSTGKPVSSPGEKAGALLWDDPALDKRLEKAALGLKAPRDLHAAYLQLKLKILPVTLEKLRAANTIYREELSRIKELTLPQVSPASQEFPLLTRSRAGLEAYLLDRKIPLEQINEPLLPEHAERGFPSSRRYFREALHLPVYTAMSREECLFVTNAVKDFFMAG